jgi:SPP1 family predicted phage head-tail adaptor
MRIGSLDRLCTVLTRTNKRGASGGVEAQYVPAFQFYAQKTQSTAREFRAAAATNDEVSAVFITHFNEELKSGQIFECEGEQFEIIGPPVEPDDGSRRRWHVIAAKTAQEKR